MKNLVRRLLANTPYRVLRRTEVNRFQAIEACLTSLKERGWQPDIVVDGGANIGAFSAFMLELFPSARVHAVEPQPGCQADLDRLEQHSRGRLTIHAAALAASAEPGRKLCMATDEASRSTGAHIIRTPEDERTVIEVPLVTLDTALALHLAKHDRIFLKLDLQSYELEALRGGRRILEKCDVILCEVSFYAQSEESPMSVLSGFLADHGFELHDIASLYARPRDNRPRQGDFVYVRRDCVLARDTTGLTPTFGTLDFWQR